MSTSPRLRFWLITAAALVGLAVTGALGRWQLERGRARDALQESIDARERLAPVGQDALMAADPAASLHRRVVLHGTWDAAHTVFLDNRQMRGVPGFYVVTPLVLAGTDRAVLVQRGWAPRNFEQRERLPAVRTPAGDVQVDGRIAPPPSRLYEFRGTESGPIRQNLDIAAFAAETGLKLVGLSVQQAAPMASEGLLRDWPRPGSGSDTNYGYAFQWWAMSAAIAILYAWFQFIAPFRKARHAR